MSRQSPGACPFQSAWVNWSSCVVQPWGSAHTTQPPHPTHEPPWTTPLLLTLSLRVRFRVSTWNPPPACPPPPLQPAEHGGLQVLPPHPSISSGLSLASFNGWEPLMSERGGFLTYVCISKDLTDYKGSVLSHLPSVSTASLMLEP